MPKEGHFPPVNEEDKNPQFKVCPNCGDRILAEGTRDECEVPYVLEKKK